MSVWWGPLGAVVLAAVLFGTGRGLATRLNGTDELSTRQRSVYSVVASVSMVGVLLGVSILFRLFPVGYAVLGDGSVVAAALLNTVVSATAVVGILWAGLRGVRPFMAPRASVDGALSRRSIRARYYFLGLTLFVAGALEGGVLYADSIAGLLGWLCLAAALGIYLLNMAAMPGITPNMQLGYREPTDEERGRIEQCYERLGRALPDGVEVTRDDETNGVAVLAHEGGRVLALSDSLLASADRDTLSVAIAQAESRAEHGTGVLLTTYAANMFAVVFVLVVFLLSVLLNGGFDLEAGAVVVGLAVVGFLVGFVVAGWRRQRIAAVDEDTVARIDPSVAAAVYRDADQGVVRIRTTTGLAWLDAIVDKIAPEPTVESRIERLRPEQTAEEWARSNDEWVQQGDDEWVEETPTQPSGEYGGRQERNDGPH